jgi:hypothetical protein
MAIIPTSSNTTNIVNLPQAQIAVGSDLLILQTDSGTQTVTFDNLNVVKTDVSGNATIVGNLTGNNTYLGNVEVVSISASNYSTVIGPGASYPPDYYDSFTIQNGIILSATLASDNYYNNPVYLASYSNIVALSGSLQTNIATSSATLGSEVIYLSGAIDTSNKQLNDLLTTSLPPLTSATTYASVLSAGNNIVLTVNEPKLRIDASGPGVAKAWVAFNGNVSNNPLQIYSSYNVAGVQLYQKGYYTVSFTKPFANINYCYMLNCSTNNNSNCIAQFRESKTATGTVDDNGGTLSRGSITFLVSNSNTNLNPVGNVNYIYLIVYSL